jgi:hypothetical protein
METGLNVRIELTFEFLAKSADPKVVQYSKSWLEGAVEVAARAAAAQARKTFIEMVDGVAVRVLPQFELVHSKVSDGSVDD